MSNLQQRYFTRSGAFIVVLVLSLIAACGPSTNGPGSAQGRDDPLVLRRGNGGDPQTLNPVLAEDVQAFNILGDLYEGLVQEAGDGSLIPGVAERWDVSSDGLRYVFYLRPEAIWSDGTRVTADHFVATFHKVLSPESNSAYAFLLENVRNAKAVLNGRAAIDELGVSSPDPQTLIIELDAPAPYFPGVLAMPIAYPLYSADESMSARFRDPAHFVGNGPYVLDQWRVGESIRLRKNLRYRNADNVAIDIVEFLPIVDPGAELNMYRAGELDITNTVPPAAISGLREAAGDALRIAPSLALYYLAFDLSEPPFDDLRLRQALSMAIDREALVSVLGRGEQGAYGLVPPGVAGHLGAAYQWRNMPMAERRATARDLYEDAGYGEDQPLRLKLTYDVGDVHETVALAVSSMWRESLGVEVELEKKEWKFFLATRDDRAAWQVMRFAWTGDYNDASTFTDIFRSESPQNLPGYHNPAYDIALDDAATQLDPATRGQEMQLVEALMLNDYPIVPLYFYVSKHLVSSRVGNFRNNVLDRHPTQFLSLDLEQ